MSSSSSSTSSSFVKSSNRIPKPIPKPIPDANWPNLAHAYWSLGVVGPDAARKGKVGPVEAIPKPPTPPTSKPITWADVLFAHTFAATARKGKVWPVDKD